MIPETYVIDWRRFAPWKSDVQVEQDLILSRILVEIFSDQVISDNLVFRGGTALYKLFLKPAARYSEDIDLVQIEADPIGSVMDALRRICNPLLGSPRTKQKRDSIVFSYRIDSEIPPIVSMRIKIEINSREHFSVFEKLQVKFRVQSGWFSGEALINTYTLEELLSTKLRALYQRSKGRDLFDLWYGLVREKPEVGKIIKSFKKYLAHQGLTVPQKEFKNNLELKLQDSDFKNDFSAFLRSDISYSLEEAYRLVNEKLISRL